MNAITISGLFWMAICAASALFLNHAVPASVASRRLPDVVVNLDLGRDVAPAIRPKMIPTIPVRQKIQPVQEQAADQTPVAKTTTPPLPPATPPAELASVVPIEHVPLPAESPALPESIAAAVPRQPTVATASASSAIAAAGTNDAISDGADRPIRASSLAILNEAVKRNLKYPPQARKRGIEGRVEVEIAVNSAGALLACELIGPSGNGLLDEAALKLLRGLFPLTGTYGDPFRTRVAIEYRLN